MKVTELSTYIVENRSNILTTIRKNSYVPNSILGVSIRERRTPTSLVGVVYSINKSFNL